MVNRRHGLIVLATAVVSAYMQPAAADEASDNFPNRPIKLLVPRPAGGLADALARTLGAEATKKLGVPIIVENKPGGSGTLAHSIMARTAAPDGYTLALVEPTVFRVPYLERVNYDPVKDFTPVIGLASYNFGVLVRSDSPIKTWGELEKFAKENPGKISYGSVGVGSTQHLMMVSAGIKNGIDWVHIPYKGSSDNMQALLGGHINVASDSSAFAPFVSAGKARLLVIAGSERAKQWPDTPTLKEVGVDLVFDGQVGISGPAGIDPKTVEKLHDAFKFALNSEAYQKLSDAQALRTMYSTSSEWAQHAKDASRFERDLLKSVGLGIN